MKAIKIKYVIFTILFGMWTEGQQAEKERNNFPAGKTYGLSWIKTSPDGRYVAFRKSYDYSSDTLSVIQTGQQKIVFQSADIYANTVQFTGKKHLFMAGRAHARLLSLSNLTTIDWQKVSASFFSKKHKRIFILKDKKVSVFASDGRPVQEIEEVISLWQQDGSVMYVQKKDEQFQLVEWQPGKSEVWYQAPTQNITVAFKAADCLFIATKASAGKIDLYYLKRGKEPNQLDISMLPPLRGVGHTNPLLDGRFLLTLSVEHPTSEPHQAVDIWYSNDRSLEKKFHTVEQIKYIIWDSKTGMSQTLDESAYPSHISTGENQYILATDPSLHQDYTKVKILHDMYRYDINAAIYEFLGSTGIYQFTDEAGNFLLSKMNGYWVLYNIITKEKHEIQLMTENYPHFTSDGSHILFSEGNFLVLYDIIKKDIKRINLPPECEAEVLGGVTTSLPLQPRFYRAYYNEKEPLTLKIKNKITLQEALATFENEQIRLLTPFAQEKVEIVASEPHRFVYTRTNFNLPPQLHAWRHGISRKLFDSNPQDTDAALYRQEKVPFRNSKGEPLMGLLFYPRGYSKEKKYPMIVGIYEILRNHANSYLRDGYSGNVEGMNIRYYLDRGYFVYLPDIVYDSRGTGWSALDCVESAMDALKNKPSVDLTKVGLIGHSHGGYETNFIATQSPRFAAFVAGAGNSDLVRSYHSFNYNFLSPFFWQFEEQQYRMFTSFADNKELYISNSPVYHAEKVKKPILLWTGLLDQNIDWNQTMEYYLALRRNHKKVIALFYNGEEHSFLKQENRRDLYLRISDWFDFHLKDIPADWIDPIYK